MKTTMALGVLLMFAVTGPARAEKCFEDTIKQLSTGPADFGWGGDGGNAIHFVTSGGKLYPIDYHYNLNDNQGPFLMQVLTSAMRGGRKVIGYDNYNGACDKINQLTLVMQ